MYNIYKKILFFNIVVALNEWHFSHSTIITLFTDNDIKFCSSFGKVVWHIAHSNIFLNRGRGTTTGNMSN